MCKNNYNYSIHNKQKNKTYAFSLVDLENKLL